MNETIWSMCRTLIALAHLDRSGQPVTPKGFKGTLCGIIRKDGSQTAFDDLPGMVKTMKRATPDAPA